MVRRKKKAALPVWASPEEPATVVKVTRDRVLPPIRVTTAERARIDEIAATMGLSVSELVRARTLGEPAGA